MNTDTNFSHRALIYVCTLLLFAGCRNPGFHISQTNYRQPETTFDRPVPDDSNFPSESPILFTETRLVRQALDNDPGLKIARAEAAVALAQRREAVRLADPELRVGFAREVREQSRDGESITEIYGDYEIGLRFFPPNPWQYPHIRDRSDAELEIARNSLKVLERKVVLDVKSDYFRLQEVETNIEFLKRRAALCAKRRQVLKEQAENGRATAAEALGATSAWLEARQAIQTAEQGRNQLRRRLAARGGLTEIGHISKPQDLDEDRLITAKQLEKSMVTPNRPEIEVRRWELRAADAKFRESRANRIPWFSHLQIAFGDDERPGRDGVWSAQAAMNIPLFSLAYQTSPAARAEQLTAQAKLNETLRTIDSEIAEARTAWRDAMDSYHDIRDVCEPLLDEIRRTLELMKPHPDIEHLTVLRLEESLLETERVLTQSRFEVERAARALEAALGVTP